MRRKRASTERSDWQLGGGAPQQSGSGQREAAAAAVPPPPPQPEPEPEPPPQENCHPNYDPCLDPNASDYDCQGGSGDGPEYTGPVTVKGGSDPLTSTGTAMEAAAIETEVPVPQRPVGQYWGYGPVKSQDVV